jgi:hypothetical protein
MEIPDAASPMLPNLLYNMLYRVYSLYQCFGSAWIRIQLVARIRIWNADPDPGGLKRAKMKKKRSKKPDN